MYRPGLLLGGSIEHECHNSRPIGYYLEMLMCLAPFTKEPLRAVLRGVTCDKDDPSVSAVLASKWIPCSCLHICGGRGER